ncbi:DinB family protein [Chloroflexota bacterium]
MQWQQFISDIFEYISQELEDALGGLRVDDLNRQPCLGCNSIGWLTWHLTRARDIVTAKMLGEEQLWTKDNWYVRFNRTPDPKDTGFGHSIEDVVAFSSPNASTLLEYHHAVLGQLKRYITSKLSETELNREFDNPINPAMPNVHTQLMRLINDNMQHLGQVNYVRGMLKGWGWLGR